MRPTTITLCALAFTLSALGVRPAAAGSLENLERERALLIETMLSGDLASNERQKRIDLARSRLIDLERLVLRDKKLAGRNTPHVQAAFENYDLTFLLHASVEKNRTILDHWLAHIGVSTQAVMNAQTGRR